MGYIQVFTKLSMCTLKRARVTLKQNQEKLKIAFKNSEIYNHIQGFESEFD